MIHWIVKVIPEQGGKIKNVGWIIFLAGTILDIGGKDDSFSQMP